MQTIPDTKSTIQSLIHYQTGITMAAQDFSFSDVKNRDTKVRQAVLALKNEADIITLSKILKEIRYRIIGKGNQSAEIIELLRKHKTGVLFIDFDLEKLGSIDTLSKIRISHPNFKIAIIATSLNKQQIEGAKKMGVCGFLGKPLATDAILKLLSKPTFD